MLLVLIEGVLLNILLSDMGLVPQTTLLPTLLYIVFLSAPATTLTPMILVSAALIACTWQLSLKGTLLTISTSRICSATAIIGLCSLFYLPALAIIVSYLLVAISYRLYNWRDITTMMLGFHLLCRKPVSVAAACFRLLATVERVTVKPSPRQG